MKRVALVGAGGRLGQAIVRGLAADPQYRIVAAVSRSREGVPLRDLVPEGPELTLDARLGRALDGALQDGPLHALVDVSHSSAAPSHAESALSRGIPVVLGATGLTERQLSELRSASRQHERAVLVAPNFAIGAVLMMRFAELAARWMSDAEIVEWHHDRKEDAPSGTAMLTAERIADGRRGRPLTRLPAPSLRAEGARGASVAGVPVHSVRLPGLLAHQTVVFGGPGETLTLRHDSLDRASFLPGVRLCLDRVADLQGLTVGLDKLLL